MYVDENENVYFAIVEWSPRGTIIHGQKLNRDFEVEFDIALCTSRSMTARAGIAGEGDEIALFCNYADEGPDELNAALMTLSSDGEIIDSVEYFTPMHLYRWKSFLYNGDFFLLYTKELDRNQFEMYLIRSLDNNEVVTDNRQFPYCPLFIDAYPNPFNSATRIAFQMPYTSLVNLSIHDPQGREVNVLLNRIISPGAHEVRWQAGNQPSGMYFCMLDAGGFKISKGIMYVR